MKLRLNWRLVFVLVILAGFATREVALELRPSFLRPDLHLFAYVGNSDEGTLTVIDLVKLAPFATIAVGPGPSGVREHPTRKEIWGLSSAGGYAWILDVKSNQIVAHIPVGAEPYALDFSPDGKRAFVAASGANAVVAIDCASRAIVARGRAGRRPWIARVTPDGKVLIVSNRDDSTISLLDANSLASLGTISVASQPEQIAILPDNFESLHHLRRFERHFRRRPPPENAARKCRYRRHSQRFDSQAGWRRALHHSQRHQRSACPQHADERSRRFFDVGIVPVIRDAEG